MKRFTQFGRIALAILLVLGMSGCPNKVPESGGTPGGTHSGTSAANAVTMVAIKLPASGEIEGADPAAGTLDVYANGVFIKNRTVKLSPFEMAETETAYKLWKEVYDWAVTHGYTFANAGLKGEYDLGDETHPVTSVSWRDCIVWCNAYTEMTEGKADNCVYRKADGTAVLRNAAETYEDGETKYECDRAVFDKTKKGYRLPTEAEWEYAARANADGSLNPLNYLSGAEKPYNDIDTSANKAVAWYIGNKSNSGPGTHPVKGKKGNGQNLYDMSGNVSEWCWDWYGGITAETVSDPAGAPSGSGRVTRGGSYDDLAVRCLPGYRTLDCSPHYEHFILGFRLCRSGS